MKFSRLLALLPMTLVAPILAAPILLTPSASAAPAPLAPGVAAYYEMNEADGTTVMHDSGPHGLDAAVDPTGITAGVPFDGATGYTWVHRDPEQAPASPERIIQIPDNPALEPGSGPLTIELRYRTKENFGNITQKGQSASVGGQWKIQAPGGIPSCLFKGSAGQVATGAITPLNDEQWHNLTCAYSSAGVTMYVDGVYRSRKLGSAGTIDNNIPMTIGGKINCDQITVTCDYFSGQIDYLKLTKAANLAPAAAYTSSCFGQLCSFDSSTAADPDGSLTRYAWDFGDGTTSTAANPSHTYASGGTYQVRLVVTDNQAATSTSTTTVVVDTSAPAPQVSLVGSAVSAANNSAPTVTVPAAAKVGDRLLMVLSYNSVSRTVSAPTGVTGWTLLDSGTASTMASAAWTKVVEAGDAGKAVVTPLSGTAKYNLTLAAYTGVDPSPGLVFARSTDVTSTATRVTPTVTTPAGAWAVSYWADRSGTTTAWTPAPSVTTRQSACNADGGRICSLFADSATALPASTYGNIAASTNAASDAATMWTFVLPAAAGPPPNQPPTSAFSSSCTYLDCVFDSSGSGDSDGTLAAYAWDFGDGTTSTSADPTHSYALAGTYPVTLVVTDDDGSSATVTHSVVVQEAPVPSAVAYVGSAISVASNAAPAVVVPPAANPGDRLVLALSLNSTARTFTGPSGAGWTLLDNVVAGDMRTVVWTKEVQVGDAGTSVSVPLNGAAKYTATIAAYAGVSTPLVFASAADTVNHTARTTPTLTAPQGAWLISYWADKSSATTAWTTPAEVTARQSACGADTGRICSAFADSGGVVPSGPAGGVTASTDVASSKATTWSIVLPPA
ncbi:PKD domain-containing protein [Nocardioides sp.]|uniref:PKD domain-containing protein n=1 Tax=Nocardioides sp. TaxID=35761 RepID=UPI003D0FC9FF